MTEILWPVVALAASAFSWDAFRRWLNRETKTVLDLKNELVATQKDWAEHFERSERRVAACEKAMQNLEPKFQPLGKHYSTRGAG